MVLLKKCESPGCRVWCPKAVGLGLLFKGLPPHLVSKPLEATIFHDHMLALTKTSERPPSCHTKAAPFVKSRGPQTRRSQKLLVPESRPQLWLSVLTQGRVAQGKGSPSHLPRWGVGGESTHSCADSRAWTSVFSSLRMESPALLREITCRKGPAH